jgi:hypothetical protein
MPYHRGPDDAGDDAEREVSTRMVPSPLTQDARSVSTQSGH